MSWRPWFARSSGERVLEVAAVEQPAGEFAADPRLSLLGASYREVLDATKHQDDKVGRLLTATAFLTAGALALANLVGGRALPREFTLGDERLHSLALFSLLVFLLCVVFGVILLIQSISTPLRIPAFSAKSASETRLGQPSRPTTGESPAGEEPAPPFVKYSQLYFLSIAAASQGEWEKKWGDDQKAQLQGEQVKMYISETHNLAIRAAVKNARTNEAVAILTFGLLAFAGAVLFVFAASVAPCTVDESGPGLACTEPVELTDRYRLALSIILAGWTFFSIVSQLRAGRIRVEDSVGLFEIRQFRGWFRATAGRVYVVSLTLATGLLAADFPQRLTVGLAIVGMAIAIVTLFISTYFEGKDKSEGRDKSLPLKRKRAGTKGAVRWAHHVNFASNGLAILAASTLAWFGLLFGAYHLTLLAAISIPAGISLASILAPSAATAERRSAYRKSLPAARPR